MVEPRFKYIVYDSYSWYDGVDEYDTFEEAEKEFKEIIKRHPNIPWGEDGDYYSYAAIAKVVKILTYDDGLTVGEEQ